MCAWQERANHRVTIGWLKENAGEATNGTAIRLDGWDAWFLPVLTLGWGGFGAAEAAIVLSFGDAEGGD